MKQADTATPALRHGHEPSVAPVIGYAYQPREASAPGAQKTVDPPASRSAKMLHIEKIIRITHAADA